MATRAIQDPLCLAGWRDPLLDEWLAGGTVEFYAAGTLNAKNAWEDKDKASAITSVTLDSSGQAQVYLDGVYKFIVKNSAGTTKYTRDNLKYQARNTNTETKTTTYAADMDDDFLLCDTDGGAFTVTLPAVSTVVAPITIKNIGSSNNDLTVDGNGAETIDGSASVLMSDGQSQQFVTDGVQWYAAGIATGTNYTSTTLVAGDGLDFTLAAGVTTASFDVSDTTITKDEDDMASDSATHLATQQSIKAYVDTQVAAHGVVQRVVSQVSDPDSGALTIPIDDTIPQNTEGNEFITLAITPTSATNKLRITAKLQLSSSVNVNVTTALFQDSTANALAANAQLPGGAGQLFVAEIDHEMVAGTTSETTFKIRAGTVSAGTLYFNSNSGGGLYGGVEVSSLTITEYEA